MVKYDNNPDNPPAKVGDRILCVDNERLGELDLGTIYVIKEIDKAIDFEGGLNTWYVKVHNKRKLGWLFLDRFSIIKEEVITKEEDNSNPWLTIGD
jgi:hypothetical protein